MVLTPGARVSTTTFEPRLAVSTATRATVLPLPKTAIAELNRFVVRWVAVRSYSFMARGARMTAQITRIATNTTPLGMA